MDDFSEIGLVSLKGRANYECKMKPGYTCETGYAGGCPYKGTVACDCSQAEIRAAISTKVVTNYDKWMAAKRYGQGMSHFEQVIFDEAHNCPSAIARSMQTTLNSREIEDGLKVDFPKGSAADSMDTWKTWASLTRVIAEQAMQAALARITGVADPKQAWIKHYTHMRNLVRRLATLATCRASNWIVEQVDEGYQFDPIRIGQYAESTLLLRVPKVIMVSATLRPKTLFMCGIPQSDFVFREFPSDFNPARCPIYYIPTMRVDSNALNLSLLWVKLDQIAARRRDRKGIVDPISYDRQAEVFHTSRFRESMLRNPKGEPVTDTLETFAKAGPGSILVSPSVGEGQDFKGDLSRWYFLSKIPFEPPSRIVKARQDADPEYRIYQAAQGMEQRFGRCMRGNDDWGEGFICDEHLNWFLPRARHLVTRSFHRRFQCIGNVPAPIPIGGPQ
jgi:Rad3-related DNA helicase